jgi:hypothetical protein
VGRSSKEIETKTAEEAEARQDLWIMVGIMSVILLFVTVIMVSPCRHLILVVLIFDTNLISSRWVLLGHWVLALILRSMNFAKETLFQRTQIHLLIMNYSHLICRDRFFLAHSYGVMSYAL